MTDNHRTEKSSGPDYATIAQLPAFRQLVRKKRNFILPGTLFFLAFYFTLPVLTAYTTVLNQAAFAGMTWAWVFASAQFVMTWALCILYTRRAESFDQLVNLIKKEVTEPKEDQ